MPHRILTIDEVADYLNLSRADIERLVKFDGMPHSPRGDRVVFLRSEVDAWASQRILGFSPKPLAEYHQKSTRGTHAALHQDALMPGMLRPQFIAPALASKTKKSVLRDMVTLADRTGLVTDARELLTSVEEREELCSTALPGGLALLHARFHHPYRFDSSFMVVGRTIQEIHFGAPDGRPSRLFFLICCQEDRLHLHTLARLCLMAQKTDLIARLLEANDAQIMYDVLVDAEQTVLSGKKPATTPPEG
jgi:PTS system nitrogen regulatory IIA component